jgi:hypothetical protein
MGVVTARQGSRKSMISLIFGVYDQAHGWLERVFNNLAISYDQAHGAYGQAHARKIALLP